MPIDWSSVVIPNILHKVIQCEKKFTDNNEVLFSETKTCYCNKCSLCGYMHEDFDEVRNHALCVHTHCEMRKLKANNEDDSRYNVVIKKYCPVCPECHVMIDWADCKEHVEIHKQAEKLNDKYSVQYKDDKFILHCNECDTDADVNTGKIPILKEFPRYEKCYNKRVKLRFQLYQSMCNNGTDSGSAQGVAQKAISLNEHFQ